MQDYLAVYIWQSLISYDVIPVFEGHNLTLLRCGGDIGPPLTNREPVFYDTGTHVCVMGLM